MINAVNETHSVHGGVGRLSRWPGKASVRRPLRSRDLKSEKALITHRARGTASTHALCITGAEKASCWSTVNGGRGGAHRIRGHLRPTHRHNGHMPLGLY